MKIYLNRRPVSGPWGGGNKTVSMLSKSLTELGHKVVYQLEDNIDIIFCFDPRPNGDGEWYRDFLEYTKQHGAKIIQRVGDLGTHGKPELTKLVEQTIPLSDYVIFPSKWAKEKSGFGTSNFSIINNGPLEIFHSFKEQKNIKESINIVTHHWSTNPKKGFKFYSVLDDIAGKGDKISFTYIGRLPEGFSFKNAEYIEASGDNEFLAKTISEKDIYLTASEEEAGANHVLEAMACGLPVIYHKNGGSILDYCEDFGTSYDSEVEMLKSIKYICDNYSLYKSKVMCYNNTIINVIDQYVEVICGLK
tara:strand:- start:728 stop:1642 length:915 start_codon:yes stop_codon:yes gene_type:complete